MSAFIAQIAHKRQFYGLVHQTHTQESLQKISAGNNHEGAGQEGIKAEISNAWVLIRHDLKLISCFMFLSAGAAVIHVICAGSSALLDVHM